MNLQWMLAPLGDFWCHTPPLTSWAGHQFSPFICSGGQRLLWVNSASLISGTPETEIFPAGMAHTRTGDKVVLMTGLGRWGVGHGMSTKPASPPTQNIELFPL